MLLRVFVLAVVAALLGGQSMADISFKTPPIWVDADTVAFIALERGAGLGLFRQRVGGGIERIADADRTEICLNDKAEISFHAAKSMIYSSANDTVRAAQSGDRQCNKLISHDREANVLRRDTVPGRSVFLAQDGAASKLSVTDARGKVRDYAIDWRQPGASPRGLSLYSYVVSFFDSDGQIFLAPALTQRERMDVVSAGDSLHGYVFSPNGKESTTALPIAQFAKADRIDFILTARGIMAAVGQTGAIAGLWLNENATWKHVHAEALESQSVQVDPTGCKIAFYTVPATRNDTSHLKTINICSKL